MNLSELSPEFRVLLQCLSVSTESKSEHLWHELIEDNHFSWDKVYQLSVVHKVTPLTWKAIRNDPIVESIPIAVKQRFQKNVRKNTLKALKNTAELIKLIRLFEENGIRSLPLKGSVLAIQAYEDLSARYAGDIDLLLVNKQQVWSADSLLRSLGYVVRKPDFKLTPRKKKAYLHYEKDIEYWHVESEISVELHFSLLENHCLLPISPQVLWNSGVLYQIGRDKIRCLNPDHQLQYLLAHGAKHGWYRLMWLCDLPRVMENYSDEQIERFWSSGLSLGVERVTAQGVHLAHCFLGMPLERYMYSSIDENASLIRLRRYAASTTVDQNRYFMEGEPLGKKFILILRSLKYKLDLCRSWNYKITELRLYLIRPTVDWGSIYFPDKLFFLYILLSPFLWVVRQIKISK